MVCRIALHEVLRKLERKLRLYPAICTPLLFLLHKVRGITDFRKREEEGDIKRRGDDLHVNDCSGPLRPGASLLLMPTGCLICKLYHVPRNVEECLPGQITSGGVLAVKSMN